MLIYIYMCVCVNYVIFKVPTFYDHLHSFPTKKNPKKRKKENQKPITIIFNTTFKPSK